MNNRNWVENTLYLIIVLNMAVLTVIFLVPRSQFMMEHWGRESGDLMETPGVRDIPNQYSKTYRVANQIRKVIKQESIIFIASDTKEWSLNRSVIIQRLYPGKVYFLGEPEADKEYSRVSSLSDVYIVFNKHSDLCNKQSVKYLGSDGIGICRAEDKKSASVVEGFREFSVNNKLAIE